MKFPGLLLLVYVTIATLSLTGVLFRDWVDGDGFLLGLPRGLAWVMIWVLLTPLALCAYELARSDETGGQTP